MQRCFILALNIISAPSLVPHFPWVQTKSLPISLTAELSACMPVIVSLSWCIGQEENNIAKRNKLQEDAEFPFMNTSQDKYQTYANGPRG